MNIVAVTHRTPFPPDKGDKIRTFHLLSRLARKARVHLFAFAEPPSDAEHRATLMAHFASVTLVPLDMRRQKLLALPWLVTSRPMTLSVFHRAELETAVDAAVARLRPDVIFAESTSMAPYALRHPAVPLVMDYVDVDSAKWRAYVERAKPLQKAVFLREGVTLERYEREVAQRAQISVVTADREKVLLEKIAPGTDIRTLPNGVDTDFFSERTEVPSAPSAVFFGAMDYYANVDAAVFMAREVLPKLRDKYPNFKVIIAGSKPTAAVQDLAEIPGVTVTGYVQDIRPQVQGASVCVIPLRVARGVQNKVLEAMSMGVPVVASPAAAEGIDAEPGRELIVADATDGGSAIARELGALIDEPARAQAIARAARLRVEQKYAWQPRADELLSMLEEAARRGR